MAFLLKWEELARRRAALRRIVARILSLCLMRLRRDLSCQRRSRTSPLRNFSQRHVLEVKLTPADARRLALLGGHLLPAMIVLQHVLALGGRKLLKLMIALENLLALFGRELPEMR